MSTTWLIDKNLSQSTLASAYTAGNTSITLQTGDGAKFSSPGAGQAIMLALEDPPAFFLVCTGRSGDTLTVQTTGAEGTTAISESTGCKVTQVITAGVFSDLLAAGAVSVTSKGDLQGFSTVPARIPVGADGTALIADSTQTLGLKYAAVAGLLWSGSGPPAVPTYSIRQSAKSSEAPSSLAYGSSIVAGNLLVAILNALSSSCPFARCPIRFRPPRC